MSEKDKLRYGFFLGCVAPNRYPFIESSIRAVFDHLDAELLQEYSELFIFHRG